MRPSLAALVLLAFPLALRAAPAKTVEQMRAQMLAEREKALERYRAAAEANPADAKAFYGWGQELARRDRHAEAVEKFRRAVEIDPRFAAAYVDWGQSLRNLKRSEEALEKFRRAEEINPAENGLYFAWAGCLMELGRGPETPALYQKQVALDPENAAAYSMWAHEVKDPALYAKALDIHERKIEAHNMALVPELVNIPIRTWARVIADMLYDDMTDPALARYQSAAARRPDLAGHYFEAAWDICARSQRYPDDDPRRARLWFFMGSIAEPRADRKDDAVNAFKAYLKLAPQAPNAADVQTRLNVLENKLDDMFQ